MLPPVFNTGEVQELGLVGSIPIRLRHAVASAAYAGPVLPTPARLALGVRPGVGVSPLRECARLLWVLVPWVLVVVTGRAVCLVAQRIPPLVRLVRWVVRALEARRSARAATARDEPAGHLGDPAQPGCPRPQHGARPADPSAHRLDELQHGVRR